ncbi:MAG: zinc-dependent metalloprotease [Chloroflexota bacterium]
MDRITESRGHARAHRVWDGPEFLPTLEEIRHPERWIARVDARDQAAARR